MCENKRLACSRLFEGNPVRLCATPLLNEVNMFTIIYYASLIILIPGLILAIIAQIFIKVAYSKYSKVPARSGMTAEQVSRTLLDQNDCFSVGIGHISGDLTDNYNPKTDMLSLSDSVYGSSSVAAIGVAAHECGHACQKHGGSFLMSLRSILVPVTNIGSMLAVPVAILGVIIEWISGSEGIGSYIVTLGIFLYSLTTIFALVTLPVEIDASRRAIKMLGNGGYLESDELRGARKVLTAAAMTYVASLVVSFLYLLRFLIILSSVRGKRK